MKKFFLIFLIFLIGNIVFSQDIPTSSTSSIPRQIVVCTSSPCSWEDLVTTFQNMVNAIVIGGYFIAFLMASIGAFLMMLHGPSPNLYDRGKNLVITAIFGYILILISAVIFDLILDFFEPQFANAGIINFNFAFANNGTNGGNGNENTNCDENPYLCYYNIIKERIGSSLKCGKDKTEPLDKLVACFFDAIGLLQDIALILLGFAIALSAFYLITFPLTGTGFLGLGNIGRAKNILLWSLIGFIIVLLSKVIKEQIEVIFKIE